MKVFSKHAYISIKLNEMSNMDIGHYYKVALEIEYLAYTLRTGIIDVCDDKTIEECRKIGIEIDDEWCIEKEEIE